MNKKSTIFFLEPYVHISIGKAEILLWNTLNKKYVNIENDTYFSERIKKIRSKKNCGVIELDQSILLGKGNKKTLNEIRAKYIGDIIENLKGQKPVSIYPIAKLKTDFVVNKESDSPEGKKIVHLLNEITLHLNYYADDKIREGHKQFIYSIADKSTHEAVFGQISKLISDSKNSYLYNCNVMGGNILQYKSLNNLLPVLREHDFLKSFYFHFENFNFGLFENHFHKYYEDDKFNFNVFCFPSAIDGTKYQEILAFNEKHDIKLNIVFLVQSPGDLKKVTESISNNAFEIKPYYNGNNIGFFRKYVFPSEKEILKDENDTSMKDIFAKEAFNILHFGKIYVTPHGEVYSSFHEESIGNIRDSTLQELIYNAIFKRDIWLMRRNKVKPCKDCVYNFLCPPVHDYEFVMKRHNLCNVIF